MNLINRFADLTKEDKILDEDYIYNFIQEYKDLNNLGSNLKGIGFLEKKDKEFLKVMKASISYCSNNWIYLYYPQLIKEIINLDKEYMTTENINLSILRFIYHELIHAKQHKICETKSELSDLLINSREFVYNNQELYLQNHDIFITEYNANIESALLTKEFKTNVTENRDIDEFVYIYLYYGYLENSPLEKYNELTKQNILPIEMDELNKIKYGMPATEEELEKVLTKGGIYGNSI